MTGRGLFAILLLAVRASVGAAPAAAQGSPELSAADLRSDLFAIAHDSMGGRDTGEPGNYKAAEWVAASFRRFGLRPAGENGTFFQTLAFVRTAPDAASRITAVPLRYRARNVVAILPGRDPALRSTYVSLSAHNDHLGVSGTSVDHDSTRAHNRVVRPAGADSPNRPATAKERVRIRALRDSLRTDHAPRPDSIYNGADDDGSGTVTLVEVARALAAGPRPRRSVLFVSHAAEERGLLGSEWFTEHPTVPRDSIVGEMDLDMVGRGTAADLPGGGPEYLEVVGARRLSTEFGDLLEAANARLAQPFRFNYEFDAPGHPLRYYCRADHYSYARYGIPSVSLSRGVHFDYHQVTDEPQYIAYDDMTRVGQLVLETARAVANLDHRPTVDGRRTDPNAPCRQ